MGKTSRWIRNLLTGGKKDKDRDKDRDKDGEKNATDYQIASHGTEENPATPISIPPTTPKEKRRWSFRRSTATVTCQKEYSDGMDNAVTIQPPPPPPPPQSVLESEDDQQRKHAMAGPAAAVIRLTPASTRRGSLIEDVAAIKIQSVFRAYLARKALCALKGLVKLQALVRGHLVRKQAAATIRCMQALLSVQARARAQRISTAAAQDSNPRVITNHRKSTHDNGFSHSSYCFDVEENIKIVEMDLGESKGSTKISRNSCSSNHSQTERTGHRFSTHSAPNCAYSKRDLRQGHNSGLSIPDPRDTSPATSVLTATSPRACSGHFQDYSFGTAQNSPHYHYSAVSKQLEEYPEALCYHHHDYPFFPSYMANTESSRAKVRSHSAPKARPDSFERQLPPSSSRRRPSVEGRNVPRAVRMQRSSSHLGSAALNHQYPWSIKLDRSTVSLKGSECGSSNTVLTNTHYCRSLVGFDVSGNRY